MSLRILVGCKRVIDYAVKVRRKHGNLTVILDFVAVHIIFLEVDGKLCKHFLGNGRSANKRTVSASSSRLRVHNNMIV